jgi:hypothetical protein
MVSEAAVVTVTDVFLSVSHYAAVSGRQIQNLYAAILLSILVDPKLWFLFFKDIGSIVLCL